MTALGWPDVAKATRAPTQNVMLHWPILVEALAGEGIGQPLVQVAAAATVAVETGVFAPIRERRASATRQPDLWKLQERYWPSGYYGRGFLQHTWEDEYRRLGAKFGVDLLAEPDRLLEPDLSAKALADFFRRKDVDGAALKQDWARTRKLVNGGYHGWEAYKGHVARLLPLVA